MGATISQHTDLFYNEYIASLEAKNFCRLEWGAQEAFLKKHNLWVDMKQGSHVNNTARLVKGVSDHTTISRNILYLVGGVVSTFYEDNMNKVVHRLEAIYDESQNKDLIISERTEALAAARDQIELLQRERANHICHSSQTPMSIENPNKEILSGSTSTINTNDSSILKPITIPDDLPIQPLPDQLQELMNLDIPDDALPKPVTPPPASNNKEKQPNKKKNKELTPHIVTGYTIPPNLKQNVRDIMLYDIPGSWDAEKIMEEINKHLGSLIKASVTAKGKYRCDILVRWFPGDWSLAQRQQRLSQQAIIKDVPSTCKELDIFHNQEFKETFNWEAIKLVKTPKGSKLIGYFGHHDDLIKAIRQPFIISNKSFNWSHDTFRHNKSPDKKSHGPKDTSKKSKHSSKDRNNKKNKSKTRSSSSSSSGSVAEILASLVKLLTKQDSKKSRKRSKSRGSSKAN
ncbi:hypothetical protein C1645_856027 [Glomus cerebriforme]|uniref:Uncharacterized protein n=1 Tax=Glomus cerebriforme TaxID=658196 RepID=A0A397TFH1_9GLOM|nr:hypothetical protein C1645_856027 [Glomus cerebriforme]